MGSVCGLVFACLLLLELTLDIFLCCCCCCFRYRLTIYYIFISSQVDPAWALFESAARIDDDCDIAQDKGGSRPQRDDYFPEKIIVSGAGV